MKIIRASEIEYIPANHESQKNPEVWKKVLFKRDDLLKGKISQKKKNKNFLVSLLS